MDKARARARRLRAAPPPDQHASLVSMVDRAWREAA